ncbi:hypothetical protein D4764_12G0003610 [Takifugu flavidus]|uniref:Uncharacterized protein n=1 Tax=Takifugu flavidus TaxID=433684 RepID=A0A5C6PDW2_9TELE|nr:hypothetical protein D4764_12G0003610 [Takifugu flavidus]
MSAEEWKYLELPNNQGVNPILCKRQDQQLDKPINKAVWQQKVDIQAFVSAKKLRQLESAVGRDTLQRCDYRCSCADGVGRVSLECLSSERDAVVLEGAWPSRRARALAAALTLFFKVTSEGGAFRRMCGSLIKCCSLPRLMGQIAHYAGLYIMSNCLLLSLPANEPSSYIPGRKTKI